MQQNQKEIVSRDNPAVKQYVRLASSRKERRETGLFVTEGLKLTCEAFQAGCLSEALYATEEALDRFYDALSQVMLDSAQFCRITPMVAEKLAQSVSTQGVFGVFRMLDNAEQPVKISNNGKYILLSSLQDPGNLGTILRTAAAMGIDGAVLSEDCPDIYSPKVLRAAMGGVFKLPVTVSADLNGVIAALRKQEVPVYAAALHTGAVSVRDVPLDGGCAVVIGNEGAGLSPDLIAQCDGALTIPMREDSESLNAAMAAGIVMWEMAKRR